MRVIARSVLRDEAISATPVDHLRIEIASLRSQ